MIQLKSIKNPFEEKWILMTPEIAEYFLSNNIGNRTVNERNVSKMVADLKMKHGKMDLSRILSR